MSQLDYAPMQDALGKCKGGRELLSATVAGIKINIGGKIVHLGGGFCMNRTNFVVI